MSSQLQQQATPRPIVVGGESENSSATQSSIANLVTEEFPDEKSNYQVLLKNKERPKTKNLLIQN